MNNDLRELLAAQEHDRWSRWMQYLFQHGTRNPDGSFTINAEKVARWMRQMNTIYDHLSEPEKDSDRREADLTLLLINSPQKTEPVHVESYGKMELVPHLRINGQDFQADVVLEFMDLLGDPNVDGYSSAVVCDHPGLVSLMRQLGAIRTNAKGSAFRGPKFRTFANAIGYELLYDFRDEK